MYLIQHISYYFICRCHQIELGCMGRAIAMSISKELDAFINFMRKDMLDNVSGNLCYPCKHCKMYLIQHISP
jgi:hypothetical protein